MTQSTAHTPTFMLDYMNYDFTSYSDNQVEEITSYADIIRDMKNNVIDSINGIADCICSQWIQVNLDAGGNTLLQYDSSNGRWNIALEGLPIETLLDVFEALKNLEC